LIIAINDGGKGENHSLRGLLPVSYNLFIRNNINYKSLNIGKMITNQVMKRPMGNFLVEQRTKSSHFSLFIVYYILYEHKSFYPTSTIWAYSMELHFTKVIYFFDNQPSLIEKMFNYIPT
ncbi:MAG: hypothetical protein PUE09_08255, partial [Prevotella copri]|nr:hypothetical protein [Segatella copri]